MELRLPPLASSMEDVCATHAFVALPALIQQLERDEQHVVIGYFYEQRSIQQLARELECDPERVTALLQSALGALRRQLSD